MTYKKTFVLSFLLLGFTAPGFAQQGGGLAQVPVDTLIPSKVNATGGFKPVVNINTFYRLHVGAAYNFVRQSSDDIPQTIKHTVGLNYSITEKSFHPYYNASIPEAVGKWNLSLLAGYDGVRRMNFYGVGNETVRNPPNSRYNWLRTENLYASLGLDKTFSQRHNIGFSLLYDGIRVMDDEDRLVAREMKVVEPAQYNRMNFLGSRATYSFVSLNRPNLPTKGMELTTSASYSENMQRRGHSFARFSGDLNVYVPLFGDFSYVARAGAATMTGNADFYQLNTVGGTNTLRGFERYRFYGKTSFYNQNELRWMPFVDTRFYKGELGFFALLDQGRVWQPGEASNTMHYGYGAGIILSPLNKFVITTAYAISNEDRRFHLSLKRIF